MAALFPEAKDKLNIDEIIDEYNHLLGNPDKIINSDSVVQQIRARNAQLIQQAQRAQMLQNGGAAAVGAAKTLSDTDVGQGQNALQMMLGRGGQDQGPEQ